MPMVAAPLIGAAASGLVTFATGATFFGLTGIAAALASFATTFALGMVSSLLTPKPKIPTVTGLDGTRNQMIRQPIPPMEVVYGEIKKSGPLALTENTQSNKFVHLVVVVACHEVQALNTVYVNGTPVFNDWVNPSTGAVTTGKFAGKLWIKKHLGTPDQAADSHLLANITKVDSNFRLRGCAYLYVWYETDRDLFPQGAQIAVRVQGAKCYDSRSGTSRYTCNNALIWRDYLTNTKYGRKEVTTRVSDSHVTAAANTCDEFVNCKALAHSVTGVGTASNSLKVDGELCKFQTGDRVRVTSTSGLPTGITGGVDYYAIIAKEQSTDSSSVEVQFASTYLNALAGTSISVSSAGSGTVTITKNGEPRYSASGMFRLTQDTIPADIMESILQSMAGYAFKPGGKWVVFAGSYQSPTVAYDIDDLAGSGLKVTTKQSKSARFNAVRGTYISPLNYDQPDTYPSVTSAPMEAADGGERRFLTVDLPWTPRAQTAQRIAKIMLLRIRRQETLTLTLNASGLLCQPGDTIEFSYDRYGWADKTWQVADWEFAAIAGNDTTPPGLGVTLILRETDSGIYDFDPTSEEDLQEPAPSSNLPNPFDRPEAPTALVVTSGSNELFVAGDGSVVSRIKVQFTESLNGFVDSYIFRWKLSTDSQYLSTPLISGRTGTMVHYISPVQDGENYDIQIVSRNHLGVTSETPAEVLNYTVVGKTEAPPIPTQFAVARMADGTRRFSFALDNPPADVRVGGGFKIRWYLGTTSDWSVMTPLHTGTLTVSPYETNELAAGNYTFAIKAVDSTGNESVTPSFITAELGNPRLRNALLQQFENPSWPGTKTDCFVDTDGQLHAISDGDWTGLPGAWSALSGEWDTLLTNRSPITYVTQVIDLGVDAVFIPLVSVESQGTQTITAKYGTTADGTVTGSFAAITGQVTARYVQIKVEVAHATAPIIASMTTILDGDVTTEEYNDVNTATASESWFVRVAAGHIKVGSHNGDLAVITSAKIVALQNVGGGWTWELVSKSQTVGGYVAAEFKIYNASNVLADALVDVELRGPTAA